MNTSSRCARNFAKFEHGPHDFINIAQALNATRDLDGHYVEIGCYGGSSSGAALRYLRYKAIPKTCWFFDVFEGFTYEAAEQSSDAFWAGGHMTHGLEFIKAGLMRYEARHQGLNVRVVKSNIVTDGLPAEIERICVANVDVDLYEAVYAALVKVHPKMVTGGVVICGDAGHTPWCIGARLAFEQFMANEGRGASTQPSTCSPAGVPDPPPRRGIRCGAAELGRQGSRAGGTPRPARAPDDTAAGRGGAARPPDGGNPEQHLLAGVGAAASPRPHAPSPLSPTLRQQGAEGAAQGATSRLGSGVEHAGDQ